jgi:tetratricopeptide (TPR) repeat protein
VVYELALLPHLCELYVRTGRPAEAYDHLIQAQNIGGSSTDLGALSGDLLLAEGVVSAAVGRLDHTEAAFNSAVEVYQKYRLPWDEARGYYEWAIALMGAEDGRPITGDPQALLKRALSLWEPMGASLYAEQCRARLA